MAAFQGSVTTGEVALVNGVAQTVLQLHAPANQRAKLLQLGFYFEGTSPTGSQVLAEILRQTDAGTGGGALTVQKWDNSLPETLQVSAKNGFSVEPTAGGILSVKRVHPQAGYESLLPWGNELIMAGGSYLGLRLTIPAGQPGMSIRAEARWEE